MKVTIKEYEAKSAEKGQLSRFKRIAEDENDFSMCESLKNSVRVLEEEFFNHIPKVSISFMIGYRSYYREVVRIGKWYFDGSTKMTKGDGYRCIEEIATITPEMTNEMISDSYYY